MSLSFELTENVFNEVKFVVETDVLVRCLVSSSHVTISEH